MAQVLGQFSDTPGQGCSPGPPRDLRLGSVVFARVARRAAFRPKARAGPRWAPDLFAAQALALALGVAAVPRQGEGFGFVAVPSSSAGPPGPMSDWAFSRTPHLSFASSWRVRGDRRPVSQTWRSGPARSGR